jgi:uncharacterized membrane protein
MPTRVLTEPEKAKLLKFKISTERFHEEYNQLTTAGFTDKQATTLIIKKYSSNTVKAVCGAYEALLAKPYELSLEQIVRIVSHHGGSHNIAAVQSAFAELRGLQFTAEQIVRIVSHDGGSKNIAAVQSAFVELQALQFTAEQIVRIASHDGGSKNIAAVQSAFTELQGLQFTAEQIVSIASHNGGSHNLAAVQSAFIELQGLQFTAEQIVRMVSHGGGSKNIAAVQSAFTQLQGLQFTAEQIVSMVSHGGGSHNLAAVQLAFIELQGLQFTAEQIVSIAGHNGGSQNIAAVQSAFLELQGLQFTPEQIVRMVSHGGGSKNIESVRSAFTQMQGLQFTAEQIVRIVSHDGGSHNIAAVQKYFEVLQQYHFTPKAMVRLASRKGGSGVIRSTLGLSREEGGDLSTFLGDLFPSHGMPSQVNIEELVRELGLNDAAEFDDVPSLFESDVTDDAAAGVLGGSGREEVSHPVQPVMPTQQGIDALLEEMEFYDAENDDASSLFDLEVTVDAAAGDLGGPREVSAAPVAETLPVHTAEAAAPAPESTPAISSHGLFKRKSGDERAVSSTEDPGIDEGSKRQNTGLWAAV